MTTGDSSHEKRLITLETETKVYISSTVKALDEIHSSIREMRKENHEEHKKVYDELTALKQFFLDRIEAIKLENYTWRRMSYVSIIVLLLGISGWLFARSFPFPAGG